MKQVVTREETLHHVLSGLGAEQNKAKTEDISTYIYLEAGLKAPNKGECFHGVRTTRDKSHNSCWDFI